MIDSDLAELYGVETKRLNEQVKRNIDRFPDRFMFQLTKEEAETLRSQFATSKDFSRSQIATSKDFSRSQIATLNETEDVTLQQDVLRSQFVTSKTEMRGKNIKYLPYAFTEQGCAMLSAVLRSETAVQVSIRIMDAFVQMRHFLQTNAQIFAELRSIKQHQLDSDLHQKEADKRIDELFSRMDKYAVDDTQGIFFQGQIFDAYAKFESFIAKAKKDIVLIDGYVDLSVLERLTKKKKGVSVTIYTDAKTKLTVQDIQKFNAQYPALTVRHTAKMHDRFLIIDGATLYHIGASLKDLGKKCFAFEILDPSLISAILANV
ncbi:MAG: ORF6N domain-containing protein [Treponema sp.]|nr:ORF6N domain-containing protein [Treponema sp.]